MNINWRILVFHEYIEYTIYACGNNIFLTHLKQFGEKSLKFSFMRVISKRKKKEKNNNKENKKQKFVRDLQGHSNDTYIITQYLV